MRRGRVQDGRRSDLTLPTRARRPICDATIPGQEELRLLVQPGTCSPDSPKRAGKTTHSCVSAPPSRPSIITVSMVSRKRAPHTGEAQGQKLWFAIEKGEDGMPSKRIRLPLIPRNRYRLPPWLLRQISRPSISASTSALTQPIKPITGIPNTTGSMRA